MANRPKKSPIASRKTSSRRGQKRQDHHYEALEERRLLAVIATDGFESANFQGGSGDWTSNWQTNGSPYVTSSSSPQSGSLHALVQGSEDISRTVDISGMTDLQLSFGAKLRSFENSDRAQVEFRINGGSWTTLKQFVNGEDDNQYRTYEFAVPGDGDTLDVRFHGQMSSSRWDYWYVDNVQISGVEASNQAPVADAGEDQTLNDAGANGDEFVMLTGSGSDSDGEVVSYEWRQGSTILGTTADITPTLPIGTHELTLTVTDNDGASSTDTVVVTVNEVDIRPVKIFILAGQSNTTGTASAENLDPEWNVPQDDVWIWLDHDMDGGQWTTVEPGHGWGTHAPRPDEPEGLDARNGLGPELSLARTLADAYPDHRIALIKHGDGGRDLAEHFNPDNVGSPTSSEHMWNGLLKKTNDAIAVLDATGQSYEVEGFFLSLGGGDARNRNSNSSDPAEFEAGRQAAIARSEQYGANLANFIGAVRDQYRPNLPFVMPVMPEVTEETPPELLEAYPGVELVRQGQLEVAATVPQTELFSNLGITLRDAVHYDAMGQIEFGTRFANVYLDSFANTGPTNQSPTAMPVTTRPSATTMAPAVKPSRSTVVAIDPDGSIVALRVDDGASSSATPQPSRLA